MPPPPRPPSRPKVDPMKDLDGDGDIDAADNPINDLDRDGRIDAGDREIDDLDNDNDIDARDHELKNEQAVEDPKESVGATLGLKKDGGKWQKEQSQTLSGPAL